MANVERIRKDIETLRGYTEACEEGTTRLSYTPSYREGVDYLKEEMKKYGILPREDNIGMLYGSVPGSDPDAPHILSGSHLDTVRCSGAFDGQAGIICALEAARMLVESRKPLSSTFEVIATVMEDGARFPSLAGSRLVAGELGDDFLDQAKDDDGITLRKAMKTYGLPGTLDGVCRKGEPAKAFLELHMEQGLKLENSHTDIGVVETIFGNRWFMITAHGAASHPSTPMDVRRDTALASFKLVTRMADLAAAEYAGKATVTCGKMALHPDVINAVPSRAVFSVDFRSGDSRYIKELTQIMNDMMEQIGREYRVTFDAEIVVDHAPTPTSPKIRKVFDGAIAKCGYSSMHLDSGAGHDAQAFSTLWDMGMIFIPSRGGLTHCPEEFTDYENLAKGADVLYEAIRAIDRDIH